MCLKAGRPTAEQAEARYRVAFEANVTPGHLVRKLLHPHLPPTPAEAAIPVCLVFSEPVAFRDTVTGAHISHSAPDQPGDPIAAAIQAALTAGRLRPVRSASSSGEIGLRNQLKAFFEDHGVETNQESARRLSPDGPLYDSRQLLLFGDGSNNAAIQALNPGSDLDLKLPQDRATHPTHRLLSRVFLLITRFPNPLAAGRSVTVVQARHSRAFEAFHLLLNSDDSLRRLYSHLQLEAEELPPDRFQVLSSIDINDQDDLAGDGNWTVADQRGFPKKQTQAALPPPKPATKAAPILPHRRAAQRP